MFGFFKKRREAREAEERKRKREEEVKQLVGAMPTLEDIKREAQKSISIREAEIEAAMDKAPLSKQYRLSHTQTEVSVHTMTITEFTKVSKLRYVAFDLETTGFDNGDDAIVEIGAVRVENGEIVEEYNQLVDPERKMPEAASAVNHITDDMLVGKPKIHQVLPSFLAFVGDDVIVAHNAAFDVRFISQACMRNRFRVPQACFDTMSLARYWPESENKKLTSLAAAAGIDTGTAHRALDDARTVALLVSATNERRKQPKKAKEE